MNTLLCVSVAIILAVVLDLIVIKVWRRYKQVLQEDNSLEGQSSRWQLLKQAILIETREGILRRSLDSTIRNKKTKQGLLIILELGLIALWALWVGRDYLDFDSQVIPAGREFSSSVQAHHLWTRFQSCGGCALWDGSERGGFPAFVDPLASALHPAIIVTTLMFGVVNGAKIMVIVSLWIAGAAQWWLSRVLGLGWVLRIWGAAMVMVAGHLGGRMELGIVSLILSTAMVSLTFAPAIELSKTGSKRSVIMLAVALALVAVAGQGYMQVGLLVMAPAYLILIVHSQVGSSLLFKRYLTAAGIAFLLAAPFLVPFLHFWPNFLKDSDPYFTAGQPLSSYLLNLFIDDQEFFNSTALGKLPYPNMYVMFVGWIPVALALLCLWTARKEDRRSLIFLAVSAALVLFVGSMVPLQWLQNVYPGVASLRFITMIGGLAVPPIVALAAYSLDKLLKLDWPRFTVVFSEENTPRYRGLSLSLILLIPLVLAVQKAYDFSQIWLYTERMGDGVFELLGGLETPDLQWVQPPFGEHFYIEPAVRMGLKLSPGIMTWRWEGRKFPVPLLEANRSGPPSDAAEQVAEIDGIPIYQRPNLSYASVISQGSKFPCVAYGTGGYITVHCDIQQSGKLVVQENNWSGWKVWVDGKRVPLSGERWLEVDAEPGEHTYQFRYQPWDVPLGIILFFVGLGLCVYFWLAKPEEEPKSESPETE